MDKTVVSKIKIQLCVGATRTVRKNKSVQVGIQRFTQSTRINGMKNCMPHGVFHGTVDNVPSGVESATNIMKRMLRNSTNHHGLEVEVRCHQ